MKPEIGKVYWARNIIDGRKHAPFRIEILAVSEKVVEYRDNSWGLVTHAAMVDEMEFVEETTWRSGDDNPRD